MKTIRMFIPLVLLLVAAPAFALCGPCGITCSCEYDPSWGSNCKIYDPLLDCCRDTGNPCGGRAETEVVEAAPAMLAAEYEIASVEVVTPAGRTFESAATRVADASVVVPATR